MKRLRLDTHALLWSLENDPRLSPTARLAVESLDYLSYVSHASAWEVAIKVSLGKLRLPISYAELFPRWLVANNFQVLAPDFRHYAALLTLPRHHGDPFDRLLIAQAQTERMTLVTCDGRFAPHGIPLLW